MSKELNIIEAVNMPVGTEFRVIHKMGENDTKVILDEKEGLIWSKSKNPILPKKHNLEAKFIPVQKSVSFMEAIEAYKNGSDIKVKLNGTFRKYKRSDKALIDKDNQPINCYEILDGEWYIEED